MKILYIDPLCNDGHINFNTIQLSSLFKQSPEIDCIFEKRYNEKLPINTNVIYELNISKSNGRWKGISNRFNLIKNLIKIKKHINLEHYDAIILSQYDELSILLANFPSSFLINHTNISDISKFKIKRVLFKLISKRHNQLVLDKSSFEYAKKLGLENIYLLKHGIPDRFNIQNSTHSLDSILKTKIQKNAKLVFAPSSGSCDTQFLIRLTHDIKFQEFLNQSDTFLILKNFNVDFKSPNILNIDRPLTMAEYRYLFMKADIIFLPYPKTFQYRSSGVFFEVLANNKKCLVSSAPTFKDYYYIIGSDSVYYSIQDLTNKIIEFLNQTEAINYTEYLNELSPDYSFLYHKLSKTY